MRRNLAFICIFLLMLVGLVAISISLANYFYLNNLVVKPAREPRQVKSLEAFELLWNLPITSFPVKVDNWELHQDMIFMHTNEDQIILPVTKWGNIFTSKLMLTSFDQNSGEVLWQTPINFKNSYALGDNSKNIFIVTEDANPSDEAHKSCDSSAPSCNILKITAIDALSGAEVWTASQGNIRLADRLYVDDDIISVTGFGNYGSTDAKYSFDPATGQKLTEYQSGLTKSSNESNIDELVTRASLNPEDVVSNYAENEGYVFFLTRDGLLWALEKSNGEVVGKVKFSHEPFLLLADNYQRGVSVAVTNNTVVVYLGDSEQLFSFRFSSP